MNLLPLEEYEKDPSFLALDSQGKDQFYTGFFSTAESEAAGEDDYNQILKWRGDRAKASLRNEYFAANPDDKEVSIDKVNANPALAPLYGAMQDHYTELDHNTNQAKPSTFSADDMEDPSRSLSYKPYRFKGQNGYTVKYPDGTLESVPNIESDSQLTDFLNKNRADKFNGKREGIIDRNNPFGDSEWDSIYGKIKKTDSGLTGDLNALRKGFSGILQSVDSKQIIDDNDSILEIRNVQKQLNDELEYKRKDMALNPNYRPEQRAEEVKSLEKDIAFYKNNFDKRNKLWKERIADNYKSLFKEMEESGKINGTTVLQRYDDYIQSLPKTKQGELSTPGSYFKDNPSQILPYVAATVSSSLPDVLAVIGTSTAVGAATKNPVAAMTAAGMAGFGREYSATLLSEVQLKAAEQGKNLSDEGVMDSIISDPAFIEATKTKALKRAGIIGASDVVLGGAVEAITGLVKGGFKRALFGASAGMITESTGEGLAQAATQDKLNWTEIINEGIGGAGVSAVHVGHSTYEAIKSKPATVTESANAQGQSVQSAANEAKAKLGLNERLDNLRRTPETPVVESSDIATIPPEVQSTELSDALIDIQSEQVSDSPTIVQKRSEPVVTEVTTEPIQEEVKQIEDTTSQSTEEIIPQEQPSITGFKTQRGGSEYTFKDGVTQRNKGRSQSPDHQDAGIKEPSNQTIFITPENASVVDIMYVEPMVDTNGQKRRPIIKLDGDSLSVTYWMGRNPDGSLKKVVKSIPYESTPSVGLQPLEFMTGSKHLGSKITEVKYSDSPSDHITSVKGIPHVKSEISPETLQLMDSATTEAQKETADAMAQEDIALTRFSQLKDENPEVDFAEFTIEDIPSMYEKVIDYLETKLSAVEGKFKEGQSAARKIQLDRLPINKEQAVQSLSDWVNDPRITDGMGEVLVDSIEYIFDATQDPKSLSTTTLKYYNTVLASLSAGGPPVGFKHIAKKIFINKQIAKVNAIRNAAPSRVHFQAPLGNWHREVLGGILNSDVGSTVQQSTEVAYMGLSNDGHQFLKDFLGYYKDNIDQQQLEETAVKAEFYDTIHKNFPNGTMTFSQASRVGVVARLTQYEVHPKKNAKDQILRRLNDIERGLEVQKEYNEEDGDISREALGDVLNMTDLSTLADENAIVAFLESRLTKPEKAVLDKLRDIGKRYLPVLQTVKAITKAEPLQNFVNYIHDSNVTPSESSEQNLLKVFDSMSDVLHDRKGLSAIKPSFALLDIRGVAENQIKSSTYEKHTGIQRYLVANALADGSPLIDKLNGDTSLIRRPVTNRLKELIAAYHMGMTQSQHQFGGFMGTVDAMVNLFLGSRIVGVNAFMKNSISSSVARMGMLSLSQQALRDTFAYHAHSSEINSILKANFPTQYNRTSEYDVMEGESSRFGSAPKFLKNIELGDAIPLAALKTLPGMPRSAVDVISKKALGALSNMSNGTPEKWNAFAMWAGAYVHYGKQNGTIKDLNDFVSNKIVDRRAATDASDFVSRQLGYSPDKASKGTFWNGSSAMKKVSSKAFYVFRQQAIGLSIEAQTNMQKAARLYASGNVREGNRAATIAASILANSLAFRGASTVLAASMMYGGLARYFNGGDEEEKKREILKSQVKYTENANRNNTRDFLSESLMMFAPVSTSAFIVESAIAGLLDAKGVVVDINGNSFSVDTKTALKKESEVIQKEIEKHEKAARELVKLDMDTSSTDESIEKLEAIKSQLTEKMKFHYFPNQPGKAFLSAFGGYGISQEALNDSIVDFIGEDLNPEEKQKLEDTMNKEFTYNDPMSPGFATDSLNNVSGLARKLIPSEWGKSQSEKLPTSLFWTQYMKLGQNPSVVVERARQAMAKEALESRERLQKKAERVEQRYADQYRK